jgi:xanthine/CO dehydrogenase XdhC/CoxF family maturation factor
MAEWIAEALAAVRRGERLAMVSIVGARGSTPRELGARMLVWPDRFTGTIGGGSLERQGLEQARGCCGRARGGTRCRTIRWGRCSVSAAAATSGCLLKPWTSAVWSGSPRPTAKANPSAAGDVQGW